MEDIVGWRTARSGRQRNLAPLRKNPDGPVDAVDLSSSTSILQPAALRPDPETAERALVEEEEESAYGELESLYEP